MGPIWGAMNHSSAVPKKKFTILKEVFFLFFLDECGPLGEVDKPDCQAGGYTFMIHWRWGPLDEWFWSPKGWQGPAHHKLGYSCKLLAFNSIKTLSKWINEIIYTCGDLFSVAVATMATHAALASSRIPTSTRFHSKQSHSHTTQCISKVISSPSYLFLQR